MKKIFLLLLIIWLFAWYSYATDLYFVSAPMINMPGCYGPSVGDIDDDGDLDLYCTNGAVWNGYLLLNNGDATFAVQRVWYMYRANNRATKMVDIDGDGDLDIYVSWEYVQLFLENTWTGYINHYFNEATSLLSWGMAIADFNGDGYLDIYRGGVNSSNINRLYLSNHTGSNFWADDSFVQWFTYNYITWDTSGFYPAAWDLNGDGLPDIYAVANLIGLSNRLYINQWSWNFTQQNISWDIKTWSWGNAIIADFDNDGYNDIYVTDGWWSEPSRLWINDGNANFTEKLLSWENTWGGRYAIAIDIDDDGDLDIYNNRWWWNQLWINDGNANFTLYSRWSDAGATYWSIAWDFDGNGLVDIWVPWQHLWLQKYPVKIDITAPTKITSWSIIDTTIHIFGSGGIDINNISLGTWTSLNAIGLNCIAVNALEANCSIQISDTNSWSILEIYAIDNEWTLWLATETWYLIDSIPPEVPNVILDTTTPYSIDNPELSFSSVDYGVGLDYCEVLYKEDDGVNGTVTWIDTVISSAISPLILNLDPDEQPVHSITVTCYDKVGNNSSNTIVFPPIVNFTTPTTIHNLPIDDATVTITSPWGNDLDNIVITSSISPLPMLLNCIGNEWDTTAPYASPVTCQISDIENSGTIEVSARDVITNGVGKNSVSFVIDPIVPIITITAPTLVSNTWIANTTIRVTDNIWIYATGVNVWVETTAIVSNLSCTQTTSTQVDCTIQIDDDGDLVIKVEDLAKNTVSGIQVWYMIDTVYPVITLSGSFLWTAVTWIVISAVASDDILLNTGSFTYWFSTDSICDNNDYLYDNYTMWDILEFIDESHNGQYLCFQVMDHVGNISYLWSINPLLIDDNPPTVNIIWPLSGGIVTTTTTWFVFTGTDDIWSISYECKIWSGSWFACTSPYFLTNLTNGVYTLSVQAKDWANNMSPIESTTFTVQLPIGWWWGGYTTIDQCPNGDYSGSSTDGSCGIPPTTGDVFTWSSVDVKIFNSSIGNTCFTVLNKQTIDQGIQVSDAFKIAHQMLYSYELTRWQGTVDYRPYDYLTREEAARFMVEFAQNVLCRKETRIYANNFSDIETSNPTLTKFIRESYNYGIFNGNSDGTFRPTDRITNDELAAIMVRLVTNSMLHEPKNDWAEEYRKALSSYATVSRLDDRGRGNIAEVMYDLYKNNEYVLKDVGYVVK